MEPLYIALICIGCALFLLLIAAFVLFSNNCITRSDYVIESVKAPEKSVKIVHLSDLHGKRFGKGNARLVARVKACEPDFIAITGDIIHKYRERSRRYRELSAKLKEAGATMLDDKRVTAFGINISGVNCARIKSGKFYDLTDGEGFDLLLTHLPHYIDKYAMAGYDLTLCGHAHGGQWRIPFTDIGFYSPGQGLFPKYTSGVHTCGNMRQVISRGLGNSQCPLRLFNRPEIVTVTIRRPQEK